MAGRPSTYTPEIAAEICRRLAAGESLRAICSDQDGVFPAESTVRLWATDDVQGFAAQYARARDVGLDCKADELLAVASTPVVATKEVSKPLTGTEITTGDAVDRSKLHVDALKWYLSKLAPKRYGDKIAIEHSGNVSIEDRLRAGRARVAGGE